MECSSVQLNDLPDEILMIIFKKLNNMPALYSLMGVNQRLNRIIQDSIFTTGLTLMNCLPNEYFCPLPDAILHRFCLQILPKIHDKIKWLNLDSSSVERILLSAYYPNLYGLGVFNIEEEAALRLFTNETRFTHIFKNQILSLVIGAVRKTESSTKYMDTHILTQIFNMFTKLEQILPPTFFSSTLRRLQINVNSIDDCLYLLDGRFNQLHTFYVDVAQPKCPSLPKINNKEKLPNLRCFSWSCAWEMHYYDEVIIPLLHRMSNLEQLFLYFVPTGRNGFIDGNNLTNIINYFSRLNKFVFNIRSIVQGHNPDDSPSNIDIQHTFKDFKDTKIISCVDYFSSQGEGQCHVYSYPYTLKYYDTVTNNFPGGLFKCVREVSLYDRRPFQHEFFLRIAQSFPCMERLSLMNNKPQRNKQCKKSKNDNQNLSIITYPNLTHLILDDAHAHYVEQFLIDTKTSLPNGIYLDVKEESLRKVTYNFTRNATRINCAKVGHLYTSDYPKNTKLLKDYFPHAKIS